MINAGVLFATCQPVNSNLVYTMTTKQEKLVSSFGPRWDLHLQEKCVHQGPAAAGMLMVFQKNGTLTLCWVSDLSLDLSVVWKWIETRGCNELILGGWTAHGCRCCR